MGPGPRWTRTRASGGLAVAALSCLAGWLAQAADVAYFGVAKSQEFVQTSAAAPVARSTNGFAFNAFVLATSNRVVTNATVKPPTPTPLRALAPTDADTEAAWRYEERFSTQSALDAAYPSGNLFNPVHYTTTLYTLRDGVRTADLSFALAGLVGTPPTPQVLNFDAAQAIDHTAGFQLQFRASGNSLLDLVQVFVLDAASNLVFTSPMPFSPGALTGTSTTAVIPAYALPPGSALTGHLTFARPVGLETNAYPGAIGASAVVRDTEFPMVTRPAPALPRLEVLSAGGPPYQIRYTGESGRNYHLQAADRFTDWIELGVTNLPSATFEDPASATLQRRFYRVQVGP